MADSNKVAHSPAVTQAYSHFQDLNKDSGACIPWFDANDCRNEAAVATFCGDLKSLNAEETNTLLDLMRVEGLGVMSHQLAHDKLTGRLTPQSFERLSPVAQNIDDKHLLALAELAVRHEIVSQMKGSVAGDHLMGEDGAKDIVAAVGKLDSSRQHAFELAARMGDLQKEFDASAGRQPAFTPTVKEAAHALRILTTQGKRIESWQPLAQVDFATLKSIAATLSSDDRANLVKTWLNAAVQTPNAIPKMADALSWYANAYPSEAQEEVAVYWRPHGPKGSSYEQSAEYGQLFHEAQMQSAASWPANVLKPLIAHEMFNSAPAARLAPLIDAYLLANPQGAKPLVIAAQENSRPMYAIAAQLTHPVARDSFVKAAKARLDTYESAVFDERVRHFPLGSTQVNGTTVQTSQSGYLWDIAQVQDAPGNKGVKVTSVTSSSAKVPVGSIITKIGRNEIHNAAQFRDALYETNHSIAVTLDSGETVSIYKP